MLLEILALIGMAAILAAVAVILLHSIFGRRGAL
jgi:hypothetical protein